MAEKGYPIIWTKRAQLNMGKVYDHISRDSLQNAVKVVGDISALVDKVPDNPEIHGLDKYKANNDGSYRAFEKRRYRISYRIKKKNILVLRVRHTSMRPLVY